MVRYAILAIAINGSNLPSGESSLTLTDKASKSTIRGLIVVQSPAFGILTFSLIRGVKIEGNFLGVDASGLTGAGNRNGVQLLRTARSVGPTQRTATSSETTRVMECKRIVALGSKAI